MMKMTRSDLITAEIVRNYLETVSAEMSRVVENTSISPIFSETHDYSCGIFYFDDNGVSLVARAQSIPVHIIAALKSVEIALDIYKDDIGDDDIFLVTDPYYGGSHIPDWTIIKPVFLDGKPRLIASVRGHVNDVGGCAPGAYNTIAREIWHEGFRVPPVRLKQGGKTVKDLMNLVLANTRVEREISGDLNAMMGGCAIAAQRITELVTKYGTEAVCKSVDYILEYSEKRLRAEIAKWPDGVYSATSILDHDYAGGGEVVVKATVTVEGEDLIVDMTGSAPQVGGFVNSVASNTYSNIFASLVSLCPDIPVNSGYFRPVKIVLPPNSVVNCEPPAPVGHSTVCIGSDIGEAVMKAFENITPHLVSTATVDLANVRVYGTNTRTNRYFVASDLWATPMSAGGAQTTDGWGGYAATFCALKLPSLEMFERQFPWTYISVEYATDTAAPGLHRGAPAIHYRRRMDADVKAIIYTMGYYHPVQGYVGGKPGAGNYFVLNEGSPEEQIYPEGCYDVPVSKDNIIFAQSGGGGGWGNSYERDPLAVLEDYLDELISLDHARAEYGVVIDPESASVKPDETRALRAELMSAMAT